MSMKEDLDMRPQESEDYSKAFEKHCVTKGEPFKKLNSAEIIYEKPILGNKSVSNIKTQCSSNLEASLLSDADFFCHHKESFN